MRPPTAPVAHLLAALPHPDSGLAARLCHGEGLRRRSKVAFRQKKRRRPRLPLAMQMRRYYGTDDYDRVWTFNHAERHFNLDAYLSACP